MSRARSKEEIFETKGSTNTVSILCSLQTSEKVIIHYRCIDHSMHRAAYHFIKALGISSLTTTKSKLHSTDSENQDGDEDNLEMQEDDDIDVSLEIEAAADDIEAMTSTTSVSFEPGDVLGKLLAFVNQVRMSSEGARDYLKHACVVHQLKPMQLRLWVRTRWGSMSNCLESTLAIQKVRMFFIIQLEEILTHS